jgi:hypothetical protein
MTYEGRWGLCISATSDQRPATESLQHGVTAPNLAQHARASRREWTHLLQRGERSTRLGMPPLPARRALSVSLLHVCQHHDDHNGRDYGYLQERASVSLGECLPNHRKRWVWV